MTTTDSKSPLSEPLTYSQLINLARSLARENDELRSSRWEVQDELVKTKARLEELRAALESCRDVLAEFK